MVQGTWWQLWDKLIWKADNSHELAVSLAWKDWWVTGWAWWKGITNWGDQKVWKLPLVLVLDSTSLMTWKTWKSWTKEFFFYLDLTMPGAQEWLKFNSLSTRTLKSKGIHNLWHETWILAWNPVTSTCSLRLSWLLKSSIGKSCRCWTACRGYKWWQMTYWLLVREPHCMRQQRITMTTCDVMPTKRH